MDKATRGDRYWSKKNAAATVMLIGRVEQLTGMIQHGSNTGEGTAGVTETQDELDSEIDAAEKEAAKLLDKVQQNARKTQFDKRVHGKN
jgi:hypothetical protein